MSDDILLPEGLKIILAVIGIGLLLYILVSLYGIFNTKTEFEQARASLDQIIGDIKNLKDGEEVEVSIQTPKKNWWLVFFNENSKKQLCFCFDNNRYDLCVLESEGACRDVESEFDFSDFSHPDGLDFIKIDSLLTTLIIKKNQDVFLISKLGKEEKSTEIIDFWNSFFNSGFDDLCPENYENYKEGDYSNFVNLVNMKDALLNIQTSEDVFIENSKRAIFSNCVREYNENLMKSQNKQLGIKIFFVDQKILDLSESASLEFEEFDLDVPDSGQKIKINVWVYDLENEN